MSLRRTKLGDGSEWIQDGKGGWKPYGTSSPRPAAASPYLAPRPTAPPAPRPYQPAPPSGGGGKSYYFPIQGWQASEEDLNRPHHQGNAEYAWDGGFGHEGLPIVSVTSGEVLVAQHGNRTAGNWVYIQGDDGFYYVYMHLNSISVGEGQQVAAGRQIGTLGRTACGSSGAHLHFSVSRVYRSAPGRTELNPRPALIAWYRGQNVRPDMAPGATGTMYAQQPRQPAGPQAPQAAGPQAGAGADPNYHWVPTPFPKNRLGAQQYTAAIRAGQV
jgi:murein DD-endopeptidase MepM/ murein hydrolase activator NlpD